MKHALPGSLNIHKEEAEMWQRTALWNQSVVISIFIFFNHLVRLSEVKQAEGGSAGTDGEHYVCMM